MTSPETSSIKLCQNWQALPNLRQIHVVGRVDMGTAVELLNLAKARHIKTLSNVYLQVRPYGSDQEALEQLKAKAETCLYAECVLDLVSCWRTRFKSVFGI